MSNTMEYKGYIGSAEVDVENGVVVGRLLFIRDAIGYSSETVQGIQKAFHEAVDDYLTTCAALGDAPDTPCKSSFNVRVGPELHKELALLARSKGLGLNDFVCQALTAAVRPVEHVHKHQHQHQVVVRAEHGVEHIVTGTKKATWGEEYATH